MSTDLRCTVCEGIRVTEELERARRGVGRDMEEQDTMRSVRKGYGGGGDRNGQGNDG